MFETKQSYRDKLSNALSLLKVGANPIDQLIAGEVFQTLFREIYDDGYQAGYDKCFEDYDCARPIGGFWND